METDATIEGLLFDMLTGDPREEERAAVLADFLKVDLDALDCDGHEPPLFTVGDRPTKRGTSPDEAGRRCALVRDCARHVFGDEVDAWTTGGFAKAHVEAKAFNAAQADVEDGHKKAELAAMAEHEKIKADLRGMASYHPDSEAARRRLLHGWGKAQGLKTGNPIKAGNATIRTWGKVRIIELDRTVAEAQAALAAIDADRRDFRTYDNIHLAIRANEDAAPMLKQGIHDVLNTLYFLCPDSLGHDRYGGTDAHRDTLHEAFDGEDIIDRRTDERANSGEYRVLTEDEADDAWDAALESYLDDCVLPELDESVQRYFNREGWKEDARDDGRAHAISRYDGEEHEHHGLVIIREN